MCSVKHFPTFVVISVTLTSKQNKTNIIKNDVIIWFVPGGFYHCVVTAVDALYAIITTMSHEHQVEQPRATLLAFCDWINR